MCESDISLEINRQSPPIGRLRMAMRRFNAQKSGATAVEFALVSPLFFAMLFMIFEVGLYTVQSTYIAMGTESAARMLQTAEVVDLYKNTSSDQSKSGLNRRQLAKEAFCKTAGLFVDCNNVRLNNKSADSLYDLYYTLPHIDGFDGVKACKFNVLYVTYNTKYVFNFLFPNNNATTNQDGSKNSKYTYLDSSYVFKAHSNVLCSDKD
jgi:TadE-like protein